MFSKRPSLEEFVKMFVKGNTGAATLIMDAWFDDIYLAPTTNPGRVVIT